MYSSTFLETVAKVGFLLLLTVTKSLYYIESVISEIHVLEKSRTLYS